jgi:hypothetical protein
MACPILSTESSTHPTNKAPNTGSESKNKPAIANTTTTNTPILRSPITLAQNAPSPTRSTTSAANHPPALRPRCTLANMNKRPSSKRTEANRANATHSTGPKTPEGKRIASHNALKTGLTGRTVLLPTDDLAAYESHLARVEARYQPVTDEEQLHAQTIAHIEWRLLRIPTLETGILALGRKQFAETHANEQPAIRAVLIEAEVALAYQKQLANLVLQEGRLQRQHERETAKLAALQSVRRQQQALYLDEATRLYVHCVTHEEEFPADDLEQYGFEFSFEDIQRCAAARQARREQPHWPTIRAYYIFQQMQAA